MQSFANHIQWTAVKGVCDRLKSAGHTALLAGGSVRDLLMNRDPHDFDVATSATPDEVEKLFPKSIGVGRAFGVMIVVVDEFQIEVATFREDLGYTDGRHPSGIRFSTPESDAKRRDFTVNALFLDPETHQVIDYVGGVADIESKILRTVGEPDARFDEDKLRLFRAVRFAAQLGFKVESKTLEAVRKHAPDIQVVSRERIRDEIVKLLMARDVGEGLRLLVETGLLAASLPELAQDLDLPSWSRRIVAAPQDLLLRIALFFYPALVRAPDRRARENVLKELKFDGASIRSVVFGIESLPAVLDTGLRFGERATLLLDRDGEHLIRFAEAMKADLPPDGSVEVDKLSAMRMRAQAFGGPHLTGEDLKAAGFAPGPKFGEVLAEARCLQLEGILKNRGEALEWLQTQK